MKRIINVLSILCLIMTLSSCKQEEVPLFNEESIQLINDYNAQNFGEEYDISIEHYIWNQNKTEYLSYYKFLTRPSSMFKLMSAETFMNIIESKTELRQFFVLIGNKTEYKVYQIMEQIQEITSKNGIVTFFIDVEDIYKDKEIYEWYKNRFNYNEEYYLREGMGYQYEDIYSEHFFPTPTVYTWWNQVIVDAQVMGPNIWDTQEIVERFFTPISKEEYEIYPLGCEQIKIDLKERK